MAARLSLIDELELAVRNGSHEKRIGSLRRITDLFLGTPGQFSTEQRGLFDGVLTHLADRVEAEARAELARRLAPITQAPNEIIQRLARDHDIAVAGPVLTQSARLSNTDLIDIAQQRGPAHLLAIAGRERLQSPLTDVLVKRGDREVIRALATNSGAEFSQSGYQEMVQQATGDETLVENLGGRLDMPLHLFRDLLLRATEAARARLLRSVSADKQDVIRQVLVQVSDKIGDEAPTFRIVEAAQHVIDTMQKTGRLNEAEIMTFALNSKYEEVVAGIAVMAAVSYELIDRIMQGDRDDALLVPLKAAGFGWPTVNAILRLRSTPRVMSEQEIQNAANEFRKLSVSTAARLTRFWQVRQVNSISDPHRVTRAFNALSEKRQRC